MVTLAGLLVGFRWFSDLGLGVPLGHLSDRVGRRMSIAYGMAVMVASLAVIAAFDSVVAAIVGNTAVVHRIRGSGTRRWTRP